MPDVAISYYGRMLSAHTISVTHQRHCEEGNARRGNLKLWAHTINQTHQRHCEEGNARRGNLKLWVHTIIVQCVRFPRHSVPRNDVYNDSAYYQRNPSTSLRGGQRPTWQSHIMCAYYHRSMCEIPTSLRSSE